jgi:hypothetical protein
MPSTPDAHPFQPPQPRRNAVLVVPAGVRGRR